MSKGFLDAGFDATLSGGFEFKGKALTAHLSLDHKGGWKPLPDLLPDAATPAPAGPSSTGEARPPRPTTATRAADQRRCPTMPMPGVAIAAGGFHSRGLREDGRVACWGRHLEGQAPPAGGEGPAGAAARPVLPRSGAACWLCINDCARSGMVAL